mmetsp:Transcript_103911/g.333074  ORF Transcript_103911/g.333074 Transcript_103911/m.333074 type:complete len:245 (+) Transcript_103911:651-1385(+)
MPCSIARAAGVPLSFPPEGALLSSTSAREASSAWTTSTAPARTAACSAPGSGAEALEPKAVGAEEGAVGAASASGAGGAATGSASASGAGGAAAGSASGMLGSAVTEEEFLLPVRRRAVPRPRGPGEAAWAAEGRRGGLPGSVGSDVDEAKAPDVWPMRGSSVLTIVPPAAPAPAAPAAPKAQPSTGLRFVRLGPAGSGEAVMMLCISWMSRCFDSGISSTAALTARTMRRRPRLKRNSTTSTR